MMSGLAKQNEEKIAWGLIAPAVIVVGILIAYPTILNFFLSFFDVRLDGSKIFIGFENYKSLLSNPDYYATIWTTFVFLLGSVAGSTLLGLGTALLMNQKFPLRSLVRNLIILPYFAPVISMVFGWQFIFDPVNGIFNFVFAEKLQLIDPSTNLIGDPESVMWVLIAFTTWKYFPITYLLILSSLQLIDKSLYEAARIDGANKWLCFTKITLPEIQFVLGTTILLRIIWNLNRFEDIYLLSPQIKTLSVFIYEQAFAGVIDQGLAAAAAFIQLFLAGIGIVYYIRKVLKW